MDGEMKRECKSGWKFEGYPQNTWHIHTNACKTDILLSFLLLNCKNMSCGYEYSEWQTKGDLFYIKRYLPKVIQVFLVKTGADFSPAENIDSGSLSIPHHQYIG